MVNISRDGDRIVFDIEGLDRLWSLRSHIEIPVAHITGVEIDPDQVGAWWHGFKLAGTWVPGVISAGLFFQDHGLVFCDIHNPAQTIIVSLEHELYKKLIVEVPDPQAAKATIETSLSH